MLQSLKLERDSDEKMDDSRARASRWDTKADIARSVQLVHGDWRCCPYHSSIDPEIQSTGICKASTPTGVFRTPAELEREIGPALTIPTSRQDCK